jgi:hypothetical protein
VLGRGRQDCARAAPPRSTGGGTSPVHRGYIQQAVRRAGITAQDLRADLLLGQARASGGDPLQLTHLFGVSDPPLSPTAPSSARLATGRRMVRTAKAGGSRHRR